MGNFIAILTVALPLITSASPHEIELIRDAEERKQFYSRTLQESSLPVECTNAVVDFQLIDASVSPPIYSDLDIVDISDFPLKRINIEAVTETTPVGCREKFVECVKFYLDDVEVRREKYVPFTIYGDVPDGPINASTPPIGTFTLRACTYSDKRCLFDEMGCFEQQVTFTDSTAQTEGPTSAPICDSVNEVTGFDLVDTENPYRPIITPFTPVIELSDYSSCTLNIYASVSTNTCGNPAIGCVKLTLGEQERREVAPPYALYGNTGRFIRSGTPALGASILTACTYTDVGCREGESGCLEVDVVVNDCVNMSM